MIFMRAFTKLNLAGPIFCDVYTAWSISLAALACILTYPTGGFLLGASAPPGNFLLQRFEFRISRELGRVAFGADAPRSLIGVYAEGAGENIFIVKDGRVYTPELTTALDGITWRSVQSICADLGIAVEKCRLTRDDIYICDEAFFTGTAAEVTHLRSVDRILVGDGTMGPITKTIHDEFFALVNGLKPDRYNWLTPVKVKVHEATAV